MLLRIIDKKTNLFIRDDFTYNEDLEFGLNTEPAQGFYKPKWSGEITEDEEGGWVEGATQEEIDELTKTRHQETTIEERLAKVEELLDLS